MSFLLHSFGSAAESPLMYANNSRKRKFTPAQHCQLEFFSLKYFAHAFLYPNHSEKNDRLLS